MSDIRLGIVFLVNLDSISFLTGMRVHIKQIISVFGVSFH